MKLLTMEYKIIVFCSLVILDITSATEVQLNSTWKKDSGWLISCTWKLFPNDSLQSVRLYNNERQFMIYRPANDGAQRSQLFNIIHDQIRVDCEETRQKGLEGKCLLHVELYQPQKDNFNITCEASGERPKFIIDKKDIVVEAFVPPTEAIIETTSKNEQSKRVVLNCTSSGMPTPTLVWTIGEQKVPHDFTDSYWNVTSKLWHVWSQLSYSPSDEHPSSVCTPEVKKKVGLETGKPAEFVYSSVNAIGSRNFLLLLFFAILLR